MIISPRRLSIGFWFGGFFLSLAFTALITAAIVARLPPVTFVGAEEVRAVEDGPAKDTVDILYTFERHRQCQTIYGRWLWRWETLSSGETIPLIYELPQNEIPFADDGKLRIVIRHPLPKSVAPGEWFFTFKAMERCGLVASIFGPTVRESPSIPINVK